MTDEPYEDELYEEIGMILNRHKLVSVIRDDIKEFIESHYYFGLTPPLEPFKLKGKCFTVFRGDECEGIIRELSR